MPNVSEKIYTRRVELTLEPELYSDIKVLAEIRDVSVNEMIRQAIRSKVNQPGSLRALEGRAVS